MNAFKLRRFHALVILQCVRWYCKYTISYRQLEEMMAERGVAVDHTTNGDLVCGRKEWMWHSGGSWLGGRYGHSLTGPGRALVPSGSLRFASIQWLRGSRGGGLSTARTRLRSSRGELFEDCSLARRAILAREYP